MATSEQINEATDRAILEAAESGFLKRSTRADEEVEFDPKGLLELYKLSQANRAASRRGGRTSYASFGG